jgi:hypothetical protein
MMNRSMCTLVLASMMVVACAEPGADQVATNETYITKGDTTLLIITNGELDPRTASSSSFWATCRETKWVAVDTATGAIISAHSDSCQMKNGLWAGPTYYVGNCFGDVSNCNGGLQCGGPC